MDPDIVTPIALNLYCGLEHLFESACKLIDRDAKSRVSQPRQSFLVSNSVDVARQLTDRYDRPACFSKLLEET